MFIVVDKFEILNVHLFSFENDWRLRAEKLENAKGFVQFELMRGNVLQNFTCYNCQTKWMNREYFLAWMNSENFYEIRKECPPNFSFHHSVPRHECFEQVI